MYTFKSNPKPEIFRAYDIRGLVDKHLFADDYFSIGYVFGKRVLESGESKVVIARDVRPSSKPFSEALIAGLNACGLKVIDLGEVPTPVLNYATKSVSTAGLMVTGSHNPKSYNGLKMILKKEVPTSEEIQSLKNELLKVTPPKVHNIEKNYEAMDILPAYIGEMVERLPIARQMKVVVDAGNGVGGVLAPSLYEALDMEVIPLYCKPDGDFPNHHPNPGDPDNLVDLIHAVKKHQAELGLAFDGDGDRLGVVTPKGEIIWPDQVLLWMTKYLVAQDRQPKVVFDVKCEQYLEDEMLAWGAIPIMWKTGHSLIRAKIKSSKAAIGGEMSGHMFLPFFWYDFDDAFAAGAVVLKMLSEQQDTIDECLNFIPKRFCTPERVISVPEEKKFSIVNAFKEKIVFKDATVSQIDGVRVNFKDGWFLVRASNTTSALTVRISAITKARLQELQDLLNYELQQFDSNIKIG
ncbi:MAG: phosphomannomutase/phosphoglucomutase [Legionellales bacterium]|nr:phosphomannomutase/phosphoglucomutase [Legionellales bacterium]OUX66113.1 MAG: hypothetical protein CBE41_00610 [Gammaproteobacteria bacterium TMED281]